MNTTLDPAAGARNLLESCIGARSGHTLLIVSEEEGAGYYDDRVCGIVADEAQALGIDARILRVPLATGPDDVPDSVVAAMNDADHTVFFARLGDQIRFTKMHGECTKTMSYALDTELLGAEFATTPWGLYEQVHDRLLAAILAAERYRITCPLGTALEGEIPPAAARDASGVVSNFSVQTFPVVIFPPINCLNLCGRLVLDRFLMSTSINRFAHSVVTLEHPVTATIEKSRIVAIEGDAEICAKVDRQYRRVGAFSGGDPFAVNSWHTGIYPKTFYSADPRANIQRWGDLAFASPRYTHFHTCGAAPGNIASATFDTTITFDDEIFWDAGRFAFLDRPELRALLNDYAGAAGAYDMRWDIGI